jgi:transcriptional regulator with XRE-family HTH domain
VLDSQGIIKNIQSICSAKGLSVHQALSNSGAGPSMITDMRRGSIPSAKKFALLAEYLQVSVDNLLGVGSDNASLEDRAASQASAIFREYGIRPDDAYFFKFLKVQIEAYKKLNENNSAELEAFSAPELSKAESES